MFENNILVLDTTELINWYGKQTKIMMFKNFESGSNFQAVRAPISHCGKTWNYVTLIQEVQADQHIFFKHLFS